MRCNWFSRWLIPVRPAPDEPLAPLVRHHLRAEAPPSPARDRVRALARAYDWTGGAQPRADLDRIVNRVARRLGEALVGAPARGDTVLVRLADDTVLA